MRLSHNIASLNIYQNHLKALSKQSMALERISSGIKVNKAKDDPNAISQSERMVMQIRGLQMAARNAQDGVSMLQTAEGGLSSMGEMLQRMRELTVKAGSGANSEEDRKTIQKEMSQLIEGIENVVNNTEFNGKNLLKQGEAYGSGKIKMIDMPVGANSGEKVEIPVYDLSIDKLIGSTGKSLKDIKLGEGTTVEEALDIIDGSLNAVSSVRSKYGALENRFEGTLQDVTEIGDRMEGANSKIKDADIALEMIELSKSNILLEAGNAMMVQSNKLPQDVLRILENVKGR